MFDDVVNEYLTEGLGGALAAVGKHAAKSAGDAAKYVGKELAPTATAALERSADRGAQMLKDIAKAFGNKYTPEQQKKLAQSATKIAKENPKLTYEQAIKEAEKRMAQPQAKPAQTAQTGPAQRTVSSFNDSFEGYLDQYTLNETHGSNIRKKYKNPMLALGQAEQGEKVGKDGRSIPKHEEDKVSNKEYKAPTSEEEEGKKKGLDGKACWDGYKLQGTKQKGGKTVDNCVKVEDAEYGEKVLEIFASIEDELAEGASVKELVNAYGSNLVMKYIEHISEDGEGKYDDGDDVDERCDYVPCEDAEGIPGEKVDEFHRALDELVHKYLGHSSDEAEDDEDGNPDLFNSGYEDDYEEDAEGKIDKDRMKCNSPRRTSGGSKKFVVKACKDGKEKIVRFGDPNMKIKKSNPKRRKSFRARHKCDQKKDKFSAGYWSCKKW